MPSSHRGGLAASHIDTAAALRPGTTSMRRCRSRSTNPVTSRVGCWVLAARNEVSSMPMAVGNRSRDRWSTRGRPWSRTASMATCHDTPNSRASWATEWPSRPTRRQISTRARSVSTARGAMASACSDQVLTAHAGSGQRHRRLRHASTTRRSPMGMSRTRTTRRPWPVALVPHSWQPTTSAVVSTDSHSSPSTSCWAPTTNSSMPRSALAPWLRCILTGGPPIVVALVSRNNGEAPRLVRGPLSRRPAHLRPHASSRRAAKPRPALFWVTSP